MLNNQMDSILSEFSLIGAILRKLHLNSLLFSNHKYTTAT